jgi:molybdenum cofactor cytidylyltransferase
LPDQDKIAAVVLAAGASRRFGSDKLLHPLARNGVTMPLAAHSLLPWLHNFAQVTVVVRPQHAAFRSEIEQALGQPLAAAIQWLECDYAAQGMAASLACGVRENSGSAGWLIGLADMPALPTQAIAGVRQALLDGAALAAAWKQGKRGHPVGFSAHYREQLLALQGDAGARALLERDCGQMTLIDTDDDGIFADVDTSGDLEQLETM